jgi:hypothetical protein
MVQADPLAGQNKRICSSLQSYLTLPPRNLTDIRPWESHIGRIADHLSFPTLVLSDLSANYEALLSALLLRGIVEYAPSGIVPTEVGLSTHLVINGDINDRGEDLIPCMWLLSHLREHGVKVSTILGNHEAVLLSFLVHDPIKELNVKDLGLTKFSTRERIETWPISPATWSDSFLFWYLRNKGRPTLHTLARFNDKLPNKKEVPPLPDEYHAALRDFQFDIDVFEGARSALVNSPLCRGFIQGLKGCVVDNGVVFAHAALPLFNHLSGRYLKELSGHLSQKISDPATCWRMGIGFHYSGQEYHSPKYPHAHALGPRRLQSDYSSVGALIWDRLPAMIEDRLCTVADTELPQTFHAEWLAHLRSEGVQALVRGHDSIDRLGHSQQVIMQREGIRILNVDVDLAEQGALGYSYITQSGEVYAFRQKSPPAELD